MITACIVALLFFTYIVVRQYATRPRRDHPFERFESKYGRMATSERLVAAGLYSRFSSAVRNRDFDAMVAILRQAEVALGESHAIAKRIIADPERYGF